MHDVLCPGVGATRVHRFKQICEINTHWQGETDHDIFLCYYLFENLEQF